MKTLLCIIALLLTGCANQQHDKWSSYRYMMQEVPQPYEVPWTRKGKIEVFEDGSVWVGSGNGWEDIETGDKIVIGDE